MTEPVVRYSKTTMRYPALIIDEGYSFSEASTRVLKSCLNSAEDGPRLTVYLSLADGLFDVGLLNFSQLRSICKLIGTENLYIILQKDTEAIRGEGLFALFSL